MPTNDPVEAFVGVSGLGMGLLLIYGAYKRVPIFGPSGVLREVLTTGHIPAAPPGGSGVSAAAPWGTAGGQPNTPHGPVVPGTGRAAPLTTAPPGWGTLPGNTDHPTRQHPNRYVIPLTQIQHPAGVTVAPRGIWSGVKHLWHSIF